MKKFNLVKAMTSFEDKETKKVINCYAYYLQDEEGHSVRIKAVYKKDKAVLDFISTEVEEEFTNVKEIKEDK